MFMVSDQQKAPVSASLNAEQLADQRAQDAQYYRRVLHNLIEIGNDLAEMVRCEAQSPVQADPEEHTNQQPANRPRDTQSLSVKKEAISAFEMAARAVRRTIFLAEKIADPAKPQTASAANRTAARKRIIRDVEDVIQRKTKGGDEAERLHAELRERLDDPDLEDEITDRPVVEIIQDILRDLGIAHLPGSHPWKRRTPADIALLAARATAPTPAAPRGAFRAPDDIPPEDIPWDSVVPMQPHPRPSSIRSTDPPHPRPPYKSSERRTDAL